MDIRLENVCFNGQYNPVFIDFDRFQVIGKRVTNIPQSCMYEEEWLAERNDWLQFGWMSIPQTSEPVNY